MHGRPRREDGGGEPVMVVTVHEGEERGLRVYTPHFQSERRIKGLSRPKGISSSFAFCTVGSSTRGCRCWYHHRPTDSLPRFAGPWTRKGAGSGTGKISAVPRKAGELWTSAYDQWRLLNFPAL